MSTHIKGNIDLNNRPIVRNPDGSISTVRSISFNIDGKEVLIPTIRKGLNRPMTDSEAIKHYADTGEHLGIFNSPEDADAYSQQLHEEQMKRYKSYDRSNYKDGVYYDNSETPVSVTNL